MHTHVYCHRLNSLPRTFNNGAAMTPSCYDCLPPLAAKLCMDKRVQCINCRQALKTAEFVSEQTKENEELLKWIYNVVETRSLEVSGERVIIPMADMVSFGSYVVYAAYAYDASLVYDSHLYLLPMRKSLITSVQVMKLSYPTMRKEALPCMLQPIFLLVSRCACRMVITT